MFGKIIARKIAEKVTRNEKLNEYFRRFIMLWVMCTLKISSCSIDAKTRRIVKYEKKNLQILNEYFSTRISRLVIF